MATALTASLRGEERTPAPQRGLEGARLPYHALAVLEALRFDGAGAGRLRALSDGGFEKALEFSDRSQLTLILNHVCRGALPGWVQARIGRNRRTYTERFNRMQAALFEIAEALDAKGIEFVLLKGAAHSPAFTPDPLLRAQGDMDLYCGESATRARDALLELGYRPLGPDPGRHLPPMIRETNWEWRGDHFASGLPVSVELHYQLWDEGAESILVPGVEAFWNRRMTAPVCGKPLPVLWKPDALAFAALHLLMHVLRGDLRLQRAWEIARFLDNHARNGAFWSVWRKCHGDQLRRLEAVVFQLVSLWFGATLSLAAQEEAAQLPSDVELWIERYANSPIEALFRPNKDEVWLHLALIDSARAKGSVFLRRILPLKPPPRLDQAALNNTSPTWEQLRRYLLFLASRAVRHARALVPVLIRGVEWHWARTRLGGGLARYLAASVLLTLGASVFLLLNNLYLLGLGYHEDLLGKVAGCMSLGAMAGAVPAALAARRAGLRNTLLIAIHGIAIAAFLRALSVQPMWLLTTSFLNGAFFSVWTVSFSPAIAALSDERNRQTAFSIACSVGVFGGVLGGLLGGRLPDLMKAVLHLPGPLLPLRAALFAASGLAALAAIPMAGMSLAEPPRTEARVYPRNRFITGFLVSLSCWTVATGAFNPFFNAFFAQRVGMRIPQIGQVFSASHIAQILALLAAPFVLKRLGRTRGIVSTQVAAALALACLASSPAAAVAVAGYLGYMAFQYMGEPGLFSLLMERVAPAERSGASALYFVTTSLAGSLSAMAAGAVALRFGYPALLAGAALVAGVAAFLFAKLVGNPGRPGRPA